MAREIPRPVGGRRHPRSLDRLDPPASVREIVARLERAGFETWCVGGAVRDALLGLGHLDWDLATAATPTQVMGLFKRTVPVGVEYGTVGVFGSDDTLHEVTTFRRDVRTDGRHAVVEFGVALDDDLARRDFTINAIAYHPARQELRDPFDGQLDLRRGIVRAVGDPATRFREDRLRVLRAIRFASRFGFHIEPETWRAIIETVPHLDILKAERVKQEIEKTMEQVERPSIALEWWRASGVLRQLVPALADAPAERFEAVDRLAGRTERLAGLYFGTAEGIVSGSLRRLRFSNADIAWIAALAGARAEIGEAMDGSVWAQMPTDGQLRAWVARIGRTRTDAFMKLSLALWQTRLARAPDAEVEARLAPIVERAVEIAFRDPIEIADLAVDGEDLRAAGLAAGPELGRTLRTLLTAVIADPARNEREYLLELAKREARSAP